MKLAIPKKTIEEAVRKAERVTGKNLALPVLKCVYLEAKGKVLTIRATNLDLGIEIKLPAKIEKEGAAAVPGAILQSFLTNIPSDTTVEFESANDNIAVSTPSTSTIIKTLPHEEFPIIPTVEEGDSFTMNAKDFADGLRSVWWSAALSSMKPELSSVYVYADGDGKLVFVATDSFRLAEKKVDTDVPKGFNATLVPVKNIPEIIRIIEDINGNLDVKANANQMAFKFDNIYLITRVIDGVFPDYKQFLPKDWKTESIILKQDLINSLKLAGIFSDKFNQVNFKISPKAKVFEIKMRNADVGESVNKLAASSSGDDIEVNVAQKYVSDSFQSIGSESISMQFNGFGKPVVIRGVSEKTFTYIVMPMNK